MNRMADHAKQAPRRDHLWVLVIIAGCALLEVWASWVTIGSLSNFPKIGKLSTDWTLAVTTEAYWGYALYSWLAGAPGPRSRRFAMWSAAVVFILSLTGQGAAHLVRPGQQPPPALVVFITALPVIVLALIAILVHLRQADREEAAEAERLAAEAEKQAATERAEAGERTALRRELEALSAQRDADLSAFESGLAEERSARESAQRDLAQALARAEALDRKLAAASDRKPRKASAGTRKTAQATADGDATTELRAIMELQADPDLCKPRMGGELARRIGVSPATGRRLHSRLTHQGALNESLARSLTDSPE